MVTSSCGAAAITLLATLAASACTRASSTEAGLEESEVCGGACVAVLDTIATIGAGQSSVSPGNGAVAVQLGDGRFLVAPMDHPGMIGVYSPNGEFLRTFGGAGRGPGEYDLELAQLHRGAGDTVSIVDAFLLRRTVLDSNGTPVRMHSIPSRHPGYFEIGDQAFFQGDFRDPEGKSRLIHQIAADGSVVASFIDVPAGKSMTSVYRARAATDSGVWLAHRTRYQADFHDLALQPVNSVTVNADWFEPHEAEFGNPAVERPEPRTIGLRQDETGLLWFVIMVADVKWTRSEQKGEVRATASRSASLHDWIVDVVDPTSGSRLATLRRDWPVVFGQGDGLLYEISEGGFGQTVITATRTRVVPR